MFKLQRNIWSSKRNNIAPYFSGKCSHFCQYHDVYTPSCSRRLPYFTCLSSRLSRSITGRAQLQQSTKYFVNNHKVLSEHLPPNTLLTTKILRYKSTHFPSVFKIKVRKDVIMLETKHLYWQMGRIWRRNAEGLSLHKLLSSAAFGGSRLSKRLCLVDSSFYSCPQYWQRGGAGQPLSAPSGHREARRPSRIPQSAAASNRRGEEETWRSEDEEQTQAVWEQTGDRRPQFSLSRSHLHLTLYSIVDVVD